MANSFSSILSKYFRQYLVNDRGCSPKTVDTYRYAFIQFIEYMHTSKGIIPDKMKMEDINSTNVQEFLNWLEHTKGASISTRNIRLAAFRCFASYIKFEYPEYMHEALSIQKIQLKKQMINDISFANPEGMKYLFSLIDKRTKNGFRDYTMFALMYATGIRVSELINIRGVDITLSSPKAIAIHGKGNKVRYVPIVSQLYPIINKYLADNMCLLPQNIDQPIFRNHSNCMFTRQGINQRLKKYVKIAVENESRLIPNDFSPHKIRHSTAMSLVENETDLIIIRDLLGHSSVQTTEIYAKVSTARKRRAIEANSKEIVDKEEALWEQDESILAMLKNLTSYKVM